LNVSIVKSNGYSLPGLKTDIANALSLAGFDPYSLKNKQVLLKPNLLRAVAPEKAVTTHPLFIRAIAEIALDHGARVAVGDSPGFGNTNQCLKGCRVIEGLKGLNVTIADFATPVTVKNERGTFKTFIIAKGVFESEAIINLPKLKTHGQMYLTGATKNMFGIVPGLLKGKKHLESGTDYSLFARMLVELCYFKKPVVSIIDGIVAMDGNGPGGGDPYDLGLIVTGTDTIAVDRICAAILGFNPENIPIFAQAKKNALGTGDLAAITVTGESIESVRVKNFRPARQGFSPLTMVPEFIANPLRNHLSFKPRVDQKKCRLCGECIAMCPVSCITNENAKIVMDYEKCIRCFCCQEICPHKAITAKRPLVGKIAAKILFRD